MGFNFISFLYLILLLIRIDFWYKKDKNLQNLKNKQSSFFLMVKDYLNQFWAGVVVPVTVESEDPVLIGCSFVLSSDDESYYDFLVFSFLSFLSFFSFLSFLSFF